MTTDSGQQHPNITLALLALSAVAFSLLQSLVAPPLPAIRHVLEAVPRGQSGVATGVNTIARSVVLSAAVARAIPGRRAVAARKAAPEASVA
jgi:hypothetical protein